MAGLPETHGLLEAPILCVGDIHGHPAAAHTAIAIAEQLDVPAVFLGDYVDRGPDSRGVLEALIAASARHPAWTFLLGNHDLMLLDLLEGRRHPEGYDERTLKETLPTLPESSRGRIAGWLEALPAFHRSGACVFVHGGFGVGDTPLESRTREELVWTYGVPDGWNGETVVRGHAPVPTPELRTRDYNINTGCGFGGYLTALLLDAANGQAHRTWSIDEVGVLQGTQPVPPLEHVAPQADGMQNP